MSSDSASGSPAGRSYVEIGTWQLPLRKGLAAAQAKLAGFASYVNKNLKSATAGAYALGAGFHNIGTRIAGGFTAIAKPLDAAGRSIRGVGQNALAIGTGLTAGIGFALHTAANAEETIAAFRQVFGAGSDAVLKWSDDLATATSRGKISLRDSLTSAQAFFRGMNFSEAEATAMTKKLATLGIDLASFRNLDDSDAQHRLLSSLSGSVEALDQFGIDLHEASLKQELLALGIKKSTSEASEQEKVIARLSKITKALASQGAIGAAVREAGSFTNQMRGLKSASLDAAEAIGAALIPTLKPFVTSLGQVIAASITWIKQNGLIVLGAAAATAALIPLGAALIAVGLALSALGTIAGIIGTVLGAILTPIGMATAAIVGIGIAIATQTELGASAINFLGNAFGQLGATLGTTFAGISAAMESGDIQSAAAILWTGIQSAFNAGIDGIKNVWGSMLLYLEAGFDGFLTYFASKWKAVQNDIAKVVLYLTPGMTEQQRMDAFNELNHMQAADDPAKAAAKRAQERQARLNDLGKPSAAALASQTKLEEMNWALAERTGAATTEAAAATAPGFSNVAWDASKAIKGIDAVEQTTKKTKKIAADKALTGAALFGSADAASTILRSARDKTDHAAQAVAIQKQIAGHLANAQTWFKNAMKGLVEVKEVKR